MKEVGTISFFMRSLHLPEYINKALNMTDRKRAKQGILK